MSLYLVQVTTEVLVQAESVAQAMELAPEAAVADAKTCGGSIFAAESASALKRLRDVPTMWLSDYPHGGDGKRTVREILGGET